MSWQPVAAPLRADMMPDIILLAVKPQMADEVLTRYQKFSSSIFISIMAGKDIDYLEKMLGHDKKIIRAMPNLLVKIGKGFTSYCMNGNCAASDESILQKLFIPSGQLEKIQEKEFNIMTALFGCAPGFILYMAHEMQKIIYDQAKIDISNEKLRQVIKDMISGSMDIGGDKSFEDSYKQVASRGGMTEAGLEKMEGFNSLWQSAMRAAIDQAKKL